MKTPDEIARETVIAQWQLTDERGALLPSGMQLEKVLDARDGDTAHDLLDTIAKAIDADRAQRDLPALVAEALDQRAHLDGDDAARKAAERYRTDPEEFSADVSENFIRPMLDHLQADYE